MFFSKDIDMTKLLLLGLKTLILNNLKESMKKFFGYIFLMIELSIGNILSMDTPLYDAALYGEIDKVTTLINAGADVNAKNAEDETPLAAVALYLEKAPQKEDDILNRFKEVESSLHRIKNLEFTRSSRDDHESWFTFENYTKLRKVYNLPEANRPREINWERLNKLKKELTEESERLEKEIKETGERAFEKGFNIFKMLLEAGAHSFGTRNAMHSSTIINVAAKNHKNDLISLFIKKLPVEAVECLKICIKYPYLTNAAVALIRNGIDLRLTGRNRLDKTPLREAVIGFNQWVNAQGFYEQHIIEILISLVEVRATFESDDMVMILRDAKRAKEKLESEVAEAKKYENSYWDRRSTVREQSIIKELSKIIDYLEEAKVQEAELKEKELKEKEEEEKRKKDEEEKGALKTALEVLKDKLMMLAKKLSES